MQRSLPQSSRDRLQAIARAEAMRGRRGTAGQRAAALPMQERGQERLGREDARRSRQARSGPGVGRCIWGVKREDRDAVSPGFPWTPAGPAPCFEYQEPDQMPATTPAVSATGTRGRRFRWAFRTGARQSSRARLLLLRQPVAHALAARDIDGPFAKVEVASSDGAPLRWQLLPTPAQGEPNVVRTPQARSAAQQRGCSTAAPRYGRRAAPGG